MKKIIALLVALAVVSPLVAAKKMETVKGKLVSITAEKIVVNVKGEEKTFKMAKKTKITNAKKEKVTVEECKFENVTLKVSKGENPVVKKVMEYVKKKGKKDKKEKKDKEATSEEAAE